MANGNKHEVKFVAEKNVKEPVHVAFVKKGGNAVSFDAHKTVKEKVVVDFKARNKKK